MTGDDYHGALPEAWEAIARERIASAPALMNPTEAAALIGVSERTIRRWIESGKLRGDRHLFTRSVTISREALSEVFFERLEREEQRRNRTAPPSQNKENER